MIFLYTFLLVNFMSDNTKQYILFFDTVTEQTMSQVGGKNGSLGRMITDLSKEVRIPLGFAVTADAYWLYVYDNKLDVLIKKYMSVLAGNDQKKIHDVAQEIRTAFLAGAIPSVVKDALKEAYKALSMQYKTDACDVAVRSSATAEDLPTASFAGQHDSYLHIQSFEALCDAYKKCLASLFNERAVVYRNEHGFAHDKIALSVGVQKMVRSDKRCSGVLFTLDTESGFKDVVVINAAYGLGEAIVQGRVNPDEYMVHKPTLAQGFRSIIKKKLGEKRIKIVYAQDDIQEIPVPINEQTQFALTDDQIIELAQFSMIIENYYKMPMDIEWALDGDDNNLYIVQARPETVHARDNAAQLVRYVIDEKAQKTILVKGQAIGQKIVTGIARRIVNPNDVALFNAGDILVTQMTDPDWVPLMKKAGGIVTELGGRTCHAAIVSRELGLPAVIGATHATNAIAQGQTITLDCSQGSSGMVYAGAVPFTQTTYVVGELRSAPCPLFINLADPDNAFEHSYLPVSGVGLARLEFIINTIIKAHPMAIAQFDSLTDGVIRNEIKKISAAYKDPQEFFIDTLASAVGHIASAFYPKPVVVRLTDFKSNEYRDLIGGSLFEPIEENPMLGFRGAFRYRSAEYAPAFALECAALKKTREELGFKNIILMAPFVRTVTEAQKTVELLAKHGLTRNEHDLKLYMMVEIPSNVILLEQFAHYFDGFSIGSNDLTQLTLGVDRDSGLLTSYFDERDPAVKAMLALAIQKAHALHKSIGICGQAPSDFPEMAQFLIDAGIDYLSLNPDTVVSFLARNKPDVGPHSS